MSVLRAPFPWFGGKRRAGHLVWAGLGDVTNFVEPFAGSLAVLLSRPPPFRIETVNDLDCYVANFWRALKYAPHRVAEYADWPINEADLHARHKWLVNLAEFRTAMRADPYFFDARVAGFWVWGICQWIGSGWCSTPEWEGRGGGGVGAEASTRRISKPVLSSSQATEFTPPESRHRNHGRDLRRRNRC